MRLKLAVEMYDTSSPAVRLQNPGQIKIYSGGIVWKRQGGGKLIEVETSDIERVTWMKVPRSNQLGVQIKDGLYYKFTGFRDQVTPSTPPECAVTLDVQK